VSGFDHVFYWYTRKRGMSGPERKGQRCRVLVRGSPRFRSVLVEFDDGAQVITDAYAVRRTKP